MIFLKIYKKIKKIKMKKSIAPYVNLNKESYYGDGFHVDLRHPEIDKIYLKIGKECIIDANFVFERECGHIQIGNRSFIAGTLISIDGITIGNDVIIAWDTLVYDHNSHSVLWSERRKDTENEFKNYIKYGDPVSNKDWSCVKSKQIIIEDKAWIGTGCKIMKGVKIGEGAIIAAGSVVVRNVEPWTVWGGAPAVKLYNLDPE